MDINKKIEERFAQSQNALVLQQSDLSLKSITDMVEDGSIDISPKYQRRERWTPAKESGLIESFLLNIPVPPIYLAEDEYGTYSVIDGKQRVTAINKFLNGNLKLCQLEKFKELENLTFDELPSPLRNALKIRPYIRVVTLLRQSDSDLKHEVFLRLNKAGVPLNSQEIRNVAFRGEFNNTLLGLSQTPYLSKQLKASKISPVYKEMVDVQYVLRFFTVRNCWQNFPGNMDYAMDSYMAENYKKNPRWIESQELIFKEALDFCERIWGDEGFMKPASSKRVLQGFYDIEMVCGSLLLANERQKAMENSKKVRDRLMSILEKDEDFSNSVTQFTSNPKSVKYRIETFLEVLKTII